MTSFVGPELTNPRAERVKAVRALSGRSMRQRTGRYLVEGPQAVREVVRFASVHELYVTAAAADRYSDVISDAHERGLPVHLASDEVVAAMSPDAQGLVAVANVSSATLDDVLASRPTLVAILASVRDPGNAGAVIRAADAAGADAVVLTLESVDVHNPKTIRATAGSLFHLPVVTGIALDTVTDALRAAGLAVLAADGSGAHDLDDLLDVAGPAGAGDRSAAPDLAAPTAWVFGNEAWGLPAHELELADAVVRVPIRGQAESLNLATAAAVCLYASARAQR
ncbi:TrmH family RNA methyltransferase [Pengzhenrongella frigida]|uniref:RNA methyltransferase n=1 Tax=Pengzhenrongella frigida TaxID=1259133 RepID=A0A4Q5N331_9MICO|nr:RNA methyltransferase [Cellulomonas sp. HLT2-17]RYV52516.1 RNA methyltransferase [Cellulomonas sp. HLT2-17]